MELFDKFYDNLRLRPNKLLFTDYERDYTSYDTEIISGKVYCYLKAHGIGKEDVVMIHLKRSAKIAMAFYGILKSGACAVIVDGDANLDYYNYFYNDSNPSLVINQDVYDEILLCEYKKGNEEPDEHDAAFILYTSSSTGKPKGCIHEYGDIGLFLKYIKDPEMMKFVVREKVALATEFYDIATITTLLQVMYAEGYIYVVKREIVRDKNKYAEIIRKNNLTTAILMHKFIDEKLLSTLPSLEYIYVSFETIEKIFVPGFAIYNIYGMSEYVLSVSWFLIDKPYDITPVGPLNLFGHISLVDENDNEVEKGKIGEIAFPNPYFRGYLNLPKETSKALRNNLYHSNDMGYINSDGNLVVLGRHEDLIKTKDGYIVPIFLQVALKKMFPKSEIYVRAYQNGNENHIVVYHENMIIDKEKIKSQLLKDIPAFMLPTDYIQINNLPLLTSGKIDRVKLADIFFGTLQK